jgi:putative toxin-antitoxin system antitoxin component (TIGR02293 family)
MEFTAKTLRPKKGQTAQAKGRATSGVKVVRIMRKSQGVVIKKLAGAFYLRAGVLAYAKNLYQASSAEYVGVIRGKVPAIYVDQIADVTSVPKERLVRILDLRRATIARKIREGEMLSTDQSERVLGLERLIGQVAVMVGDSGDSTGFDAARWVGDWLEQPIPALGGAKPADYMDTIEGQERVSRLLVQTQAGVFA